MTDILNVIKLLCKKQNITVTELERNLGIANATISRWGKSSPKAESVQKVADYFGVSIDYLLGRTDYASTVEQTLFDPDIVTIQRLKKNLSPSNNKKMMDMLRIQFAEDFPKEDDD